MEKHVEVDATALASTSRAVVTCVHELANVSHSIRGQADAAARQLRRSVEAYVLCLRQEKLPPENVVILVKSAVREALPYHVSAKETRELIDEVVRWSVEAYFGR